MTQVGYYQDCLFRTYNFIVVIRFLSMMQADNMIGEYDDIIHYDAQNDYEISLEAYLKH